MHQIEEKKWWKQCDGTVIYIPMRFLQVNKYIVPKKEKKTRVNLCIPGVIPRILYLPKHMLLVNFNRCVAFGQQLGAFS